MSSAPTIPYHFDFIVDYSKHSDTNAFYRACLRELFYMNIEITPQIAALDEVTRDELLYDEKTMNSTLGLLYTATSNDMLFRELYDLGAATFLSRDRTIGQAVLFSYDYLPLFHLCLRDFFREPATWNSENMHFLTLKKRLS